MIILLKNTAEIIIRGDLHGRLTVRVCGRCDFKGDGVHIRRGPGRAVSCVRRQSVWISLRPAHLWELQGTQTVAMREDMREDMVFLFIWKWALTTNLLLIIASPAVRNNCWTCLNLMSVKHKCSEKWTLTLSQFS